MKFITIHIQEAVERDLYSKKDITKGAKTTGAANVIVVVFDGKSAINEKETRL